MSSFGHLENRLDGIAYVSCQRHLVPFGMVHMNVSLSSVSVAGETRKRQQPVWLTVPCSSSASSSSAQVRISFGFGINPSRGSLSAHNVVSASPGSVWALSVRTGQGCEGVAEMRRSQPFLYVVHSLGEGGHRVGDGSEVCRICLGHSAEFFGDPRRVVGANSASCRRSQLGLDFAGHL